MKLIGIGERIGNIGKSTSEKQKAISIGEAYSLWNMLVYRYDALSSTKILCDFAKDEDLKIIIKKGIQLLEAQTSTLEMLMKEYSIPMPDRPPKDANVTVDVNAITDKFIYREIYNGISDMMFKHIASYQRSQISIIRDTFRKSLSSEMDLYDKFYEYGKLKGYLYETPTFRV